MELSPIQGLSLAVGIVGWSYVANWIGLRAGFAVEARGWDWHYCALVHIVVMMLVGLGGGLLLLAILSNALGL